MDYGIFLQSRVKGSTRLASVIRGLERSGRIGTSAAAIVVLASLWFVAADIVLIKALGLRSAIAVFLDATIVRTLLVAATMRLLGEWSCWCRSGGTTTRDIGGVTKCAPAKTQLRARFPESRRQHLFQRVLRGNT